MPEPLADLTDVTDVFMPDLFQQVDWNDLKDVLSDTPETVPTPIGVSLFNYDVNIHKPETMPSFSLRHPSALPVPEFHKPEKLPVDPRKFKPHRPHRPRLSNLLPGGGPLEVVVAENRNAPFVLDHAKERDAKELVRDVDNNMGEFAVLCGAMINAYRGVVTTAPAGLFGAETAEQAKAIDDDMERAVRSTAADSDGLWRQILEGFVKYADANGDPSLAKLQRQMDTSTIVLDDEGNAVDTRTRGERRVDRKIEREEAAHVGTWKRIANIIGNNENTLNPFLLVGKKLIPILSAVRPPPRIITTALNHFPRMTTPEGALEVIQSYVGRYFAFNDSASFIVDSIMRAVTPVLFPLLRLISRSISLNLRAMTTILNNPKIAMATVSAATYVFRFIGWIWHLIVSIIHTIVRLVAAIIQFVVAIVVSIYASPITGIIVNTIVALVIRFVIR